jgi:hypothetical protein
MTIFQIIENKGMFGGCVKCQTLIYGKLIDDYIVEFVMRMDNYTGQQFLCLSCGLSDMEEYIQKYEQRNQAVVRRYDP